MNTKLNFISAGAGSGKTYRLTQILHEKLTNGTVNPSGVIATTFTRKAATELRERVRSHLLEKGACNIANAMGQARINTVNGVCAELLTRFAFEAGISTELQVLEEAQEKVLLAQAVETVMDVETLTKLLGIVRRMGIEDWKNDLRELMGHTRANDIAIESLAKMAVQNADELLRHFPKMTAEDLNKSLLQAIDNSMPELEKAAFEGKKKNTNDYLLLVKTLRGKLRVADFAWSDWVKLAASQPEKALIPVALEIGKIAGRYAEHVDLHQDLREYLRMQFLFCEKALQAYADKKREMGVCDFIDQEQLLLKTLDHEGVGASLEEELDLLMVDEFQDTSPIQLALFLKLSKFAREIYWVGDLKQAIYGFRGSDSTLMKAILNELTMLGGNKEVLDNCWRSREPLVNLVNEIFIPAFASILSPSEVSLTAQRNEILKGAAFANWHLQGSNIANRNAALVTGVQQLLSSNYVVCDNSNKRTIRYGDIAILSRTNDGASSIAAELRMQGVPAALAQAGLLKTPEAILAVACLRRLNDTSDTIASAEILSLAGCIEPEVWVADRLHLMANAPDDRSQDYGNNWRETGDNAFSLLSTLAKLRDQMHILSPLEALLTVVAQGQLSKTVLGWCKNQNEARTRLANLEALLDITREYESISRTTHQSVNVSGLLLWLKFQAAADADYLALPAIDAVKVMTNHAAKGLEWPVVIITGLETRVRDRLWTIGAVSKSGVDIHHPLNDRFIRFWPWPFGKMEKVTIAEAIAQSEIALQCHADAVEEEKRLLYVSMTRARDLLILTHGGKENQESWIKTINADWLKGEQDTATLKLPSGKRIPYQHWLLEAPEIFPEQPSAATPIHWFCASH